MRRQQLLKIGSSDLPPVPRGEIALCVLDTLADARTRRCAEYAGQTLVDVLGRTWTFIPHHEAAVLSMFCFTWGLGRISRVEVIPEVGRCYAFAPGGVWSLSPWRKGEIWESPVDEGAVWTSVGQRPCDHETRSRFQV